MKIDMDDSESIGSSGSTQNMEKAKQNARSNESPFHVKGSRGFTLNEEYLKREMADIITMMVSYVKDIEEAARVRRIKRTNHITGDYKDFCKGEKRFLTRLEYGKGIVNAIIDSLKVVPDPKSSGKLTASELYAQINNFIRTSNDQSTAENIEEMSFYLGELMIRFARICESEGFRHGLPFKVYNSPVVNQERTYIYRRRVKKMLQDEEETESNEETEEEIKNVVEALQEIVFPQK